MARKARRRTWGTGSVTQSGTRWAVRWREGGRRHCKTFSTKETAEEVLATITRDVERGASGLHRDRSNAPNLDALAKEWLARRQKTNRSARNDVSRWHTHLARVFGKMQPHEVNAANLRRFIEAKLAERRFIKGKPAEGFSPTTVGHCIRLLSSLFTDLRENDYIDTNPVATLTRAARKLFRSTWDVGKTPYLQRQEDIEALYRALPEPHCVIFAVGVMAGLRVGEILGLDWRDIDLEARRIRVHQQAQNGRLTCVKDDESRLAPISTSLAPVLTAWRLATGGRGLLFTPACPTRGGRPDIGAAPTFIRPHTVHKALAKALKDCGLPKMTLYNATRHSFASQWVMNGGSLELLAKILGHSSTAVTSHYAHLAPDFFGAKAHDMVTADLSKPTGAVVSLRGVGRPVGQSVGEVAASDAEAQLA
jgi:integrase